VVNGVSRTEPQSTDRAVITLKGTSPLSTPITEDIREAQRQQIIHFFLEQIAATPAKRDALWQPDFSTPAAYQASIQGHRQHLREMLGLIQPTAGAPQSRTLQESATLRVSELTVPIVEGLKARALLFMPRTNTPIAGVIAIPSERETPEQFTGIADGSTPAKWLAALLERNVAVAVPFMTERRDDHPICKRAGGQDERRILWRAGFIVGRTLVGLEVQQVLALREFLASQSSIDSKRIAVMGEGQGGMTALYAGAADERLAVVASLNYFQQRENCWQEPVDRVLYGQLNEFGDAEVAALIAPRPLLTATAPGSEISSSSAGAELARARRFYGGLQLSSHLVDLGNSKDALESAALKVASALGASQKSNAPELTLRLSPEQIAEGRNHNFEALFQYLRGLDAASSKVRTDYWQLNFTPPRDRAQKVQQLRKELARLVGTIPTDPVPLRPRTALIGETDRFLAYDVLLDVAPGVEAYGQLLVPRAVAGHVGERLPAVICQHGFDGAPKYVSGIGNGLESNDHFYHRFGQRLAERGYVVFAPYLSVPMVHTQPAVVYRADLVNPLVRLAACLGVTRTSIELTKLHTIVDFLQSLPFVQSDRIGYYGLSYGGYSAIWMPPLEPRLSLTVISAHFNDWQTMLTDMERFGASYWTLPDEDFYNWNVLNRFDHTQLIAAMWPRPVCIEYGSEDQVTTPVWHERAWKEVKAFAESWGLGDKIVDDKFNGPHAIHGIGTFSFLDRWLRPERSAGRDYGCRDDNYCDESVAPDFHGYIRDSKDSLPYITRTLDSNQNSVIRGSFYVSNVASVFRGMAFKVARNGNPWDLIVKFGSHEGSDDIGEAKIDPKEVYPHEDRWYEALLKKPVRLDPVKTYFFEITTTSGQAPNDSYTIFGPKPLGGEDYPPNFGLSFRTLTTGNQ
jgi:dienelactone hydrolase